MWRCDFSWFLQAHCALGIQHSTEQPSTLVKYHTTTNVHSLSLLREGFHGRQCHMAIGRRRWYDIVAPRCAHARWASDLHRAALTTAPTKGLGSHSKYLAT